MKKINEIFYSLQGEGKWSGTPAIFVRFAKCNLNCPFCDTKFQTYTNMSDDEIMSEIEKYGCKFIVFTGGEPTLFLDDLFLKRLKAKGYYLAMESNGTRHYSPLLDFVTISPKDDFVDGATTIVGKADEVKVVFDNEHDPCRWLSMIEANDYYLQPCDTGDSIKNKDIVRACVEYCKANPRWRISLQTQKILGIL